MHYHWQELHLLHCKQLRGNRELRYASNNDLHLVIVTIRFIRERISHLGYLLIVPIRISCLKLKNGGLQNFIFLSRKTIKEEKQWEKN